MGKFKQVTETNHKLEIQILDENGQLTKLAFDLIRQGLRNYMEDAWDDHHRSAVIIPENAEYALQIIEPDDNDSTKLVITWHTK
ncbi:MAG: hypothetical protein A2381_15230 [Bdellovibrionales bacterium RIFOXYB1_FULL_37_110]|nr:MAG: hypothetical protein A2381_15230 [Bdellovibrionales bacterium RIFOXYB1_FULL_37_110]